MACLARSGYPAGPPLLLKWRLVLASLIAFAGTAAAGDAEGARSDLLVDLDAVVESGKVRRWGEPAPGEARPVRALKRGKRG